VVGGRWSVVGGRLNIFLFEESQPIIF